MARYRVCVWETVGGYIDVDSEDFEPVEDGDINKITCEKDAEKYVIELVDFYGSEKLDEVTHREVETCGVDRL